MSTLWKKNIIWKFARILWILFILYHILLKIKISKIIVREIITRMNPEVRISLNFLNIANIRKCDLFLIKYVVHCKFVKHKDNRLFYIVQHIHNQYELKKTTTWLDLPHRAGFARVYFTLLPITAIE